MQSLAIKAPLLLGVSILGFTSPGFAHGHDREMDMSMSMVASNISHTAQEDWGNYSAPVTYYSHDQHSGLLLGHIFLMTVGWVFILPVCVMISISRSRYTLLAQLSFLAVNSLGVLLVATYNASTPDLYPNNAHHKLGWILSWVTCVHAILGLIHLYGCRSKSNTVPFSAEALNEHLHIDHQTQRPQFNGFLSGGLQQVEVDRDGLRSHSLSSRSSDLTLRDEPLENFEEVEELEKQALMRGTRVDRFLTKTLVGRLPRGLLKLVRFVYDAVDRVILVLGFVALTTGGITYGGFFMGSRVFSGLAHFIKGGVFFWYGIITLSRWAGVFANMGWAWNIPPSSRPVTAEFVESFLIFFYGATNIFLEHLAAWGSAWSAQDLEHVSITIMFIGGGLCGMLIESKRVRDLLNTTTQTSHSTHIWHYPQAEESKEPNTYRFSMNPIPALVILLLGLMMSSHHQASMISTMIHKQWGTLLVGAAFARAATYIIFYLAPPASNLPGRPPTELITAFCLMAGGVVFMASARDTVMAIEANGLDAMFIFTVTMGFITFLMAWIIVVIAIKGLALRKENKSHPNKLGTAA